MMTEHIGSEKRENVRAILTVRATIRKLNKKELEKVHSLINRSAGRSVKETPEDKNQPVGDGTVNPSIAGLSNFITMLDENTNPSVSYFVECLCKMDEKLDRILDTLENITDGKEIKIENTSNISASGLGLVTRTPIENNCVLEISLYIPGFPHGRLRTYGEVVYSKPQEDSEERLFDVGIKFLTLSDPEREGLVAYTFCQHRKEIRHLKEKIV
jgi:PilZ domain-containing protein